MPIDAKQWRLQIEGTVFHQSDCLSNPQPILNLLDAVPIAFERISFNKEITANRVSDRFRQRRLKSIDRNWMKVRAELKEGAISTLYFDSVTSGSGYAGIAFQLFHALNRHSEVTQIEEYDSVTFLLDDNLLQEGVVDLDKCIHFLKQAWQMLNGVYGFLEIFVSNHRGSMPDAMMQEASYYFRAQPNTAAHLFGIPLRTNVPTAYWLNFLNASHVQAIGGIDHMHSQLPKAQIESLVHGGVSVQISPSPVYDSLAEWQADHLALEKVLTPILVR